MKIKDIFSRVRRRVDEAQTRLKARGEQAQDAIKLLVDSISDENIEQIFQKARDKIAPSVEQMPVDFQLRQSNVLRRTFEKIFPVSHVSRITYRYGREFLDEFMPIDPNSYIGRGSYKFVYRLPWSAVIKVSRHAYPSDPLFGRLYREAAQNPEKFLSKEDRDLQEYLLSKAKSFKREGIRHKFNRLAMEKSHYLRVKEGIPDLIIPTRYFMGIRYRERILGRGYHETLTPMDNQILLVGKHLKEFAHAGKISNSNFITRKLFPRYEFEFNGARFGQIKKKILVKITEDFHRLIDFTRRLAKEEKLILDIHSENIIITLPEFELKIFDFHLFDEHLYADAYTGGNSEIELIEVIEKFVESLHLG